MNTGTFNQRCKIRKVTGTDVYGEPDLAPPVPEKFGVVRFRRESQHSTVRADSSASRGYADELRSNIILLLQPNTVARVDDQVITDWMTIRIRDMQPRYTPFGKLDHWEIRGEIWE